MKAPSIASGSKSLVERLACFFAFALSLSASAATAGLAFAACEQFRELINPRASRVRKQHLFAEFLEAVLLQVRRRHDIDARRRAQLLLDAAVGAEHFVLLVIRFGTTQLVICKAQRSSEHSDSAAV